MLVCSQAAIANVQGWLRGRDALRCDRWSTTRPTTIPLPRSPTSCSTSSATGASTTAPRHPVARSRSVDVLAPAPRRQRARHAHHRAVAGARQPRRAHRRHRPARRRRLLLLGHTDVVPGQRGAAGSHDPFGGELVTTDDGSTRCGAAARSTCSTSPRRWPSPCAGWPRRASGPRARWCTPPSPTRRRWAPTAPTTWSTDEADAVRADYVITEAGGFPLASPTGTKLPVIVGEKGTHWTTLRVTGTPGHASQPYRTDNALVTAAEVVRRLARLPAADGAARRLAAASSGRWACPTSSPRRCSTSDRFDAALDDLPARHGPPVPRLHAHHLRPDGRARRHQDQRHPRHRRPRDRHPHAARAR